MKTKSILFDSKDIDLFYDIKSGLKKTEIRALDDPSSEKAYYNNLCVGDKIIFSCGNEQTTKTITSVRRYDSINDLLLAEDNDNICGSRADRRDLESTLLSFSGYPERIEKYGLIAFDLNDE